MMMRLHIFKARTGGWWVRRSDHLEMSWFPEWAEAMAYADAVRERL